MDEELLPCPFCGSAKLQSFIDDKSSWIECTDCEVAIERKTWISTSKAWNTRAWNTKPE